MESRRYEFVGGNSNKFWEINAPYYVCEGSQWVVKVTYGRNGTDGKDHLNSFNNKLRAELYRSKKINEKLGKGYKLVSKTKPILLGTAEIVVKPKPKPKCEHENLKKIGVKKWKCASCDTQIEFDKPQSFSVEAEIEVTQVRRFINLSALAE